MYASILKASTMIPSYLRTLPPYLHNLPACCLQLSSLAFGLRLRGAPPGTLTLQRSPAPSSYEQDGADFPNYCQAFWSWFLGRIAFWLLSADSVTCSPSCTSRPYDRTIDWCTCIVCNVPVVYVENLSDFDNFTSCLSSKFTYAFDGLIAWYISCRLLY